MQQKHLQKISQHICIKAYVKRYSQYHQWGVKIKCLYTEEQLNTLSNKLAAIMKYKNKVAPNTLILKIIQILVMLGRENNYIKHDPNCVKNVN